MGEPFPVSATVFREGHDQLGAEVVLTAPDGSRRAPVRMHKLESPVDRHQAWVQPDLPGAWAFEVQRLVGPLATWQHDAGIKIPAGVDVELMFTEGALLLERVLATVEPTPAQAASSPARSPPPATPTRPVEARLAQLQSRDAGDGARRPSAARAAHRRGPAPGVRRPRARALRQLVRVLPALRGRDPRPQDRQGHQRQLPDRGQAARGRGRDGLRRRSTCRRSTRSARSTARAPTTPSTPAPRTPAPPGRSAPRHGGHDAIHPDLGTLEDFDELRRPRQRARPRGRHRLRPAGRPRPSVGDQPPGVVHHPRRRLDRVRREPAEEVPGHLPDQLRQRLRPGSPARCTGSSSTGCPTASGSSGSTTRTPSRCRSGSGCSRRSGAPTPTCCSCPRRSPSRR